MMATVPYVTARAGRTKYHADAFLLVWVYQEYFLGVRASGAWDSQPYHLHVPTVLKFGSLKILEPSGLVQASNGIVYRVMGLLYLYIG